MRYLAERTFHVGWDAVAARYSRGLGVFYYLLVKAVSMQRNVLRARVVAAIEKCLRWFSLPTPEQTFVLSNMPQAAHHVQKHLCQCLVLVRRSFPVLTAMARRATRIGSIRTPTWAQVLPNAPRILAKYKPWEIANATLAERES